MHHANYMTSAFSGVALVLMTGIGQADEFKVPELPGITSLSACGASYNLNLRGDCNTFSFNAVARLYNEFDTRIRSYGLSEPELQSAIERLQTDCGDPLLVASSEVQGMRRRGGFYLSADTTDAREAISEAVNDHCIDTFEALLPTIGETADSMDMIGIEDYFREGIVR